MYLRNTGLQYGKSLSERKAWGQGSLSLREGTTGFEQKYLARPCDQGPEAPVCLCIVIWFMHVTLWPELLLNLHWKELLVSSHLCIFRISTDQSCSHWVFIDTKRYHWLQNGKWWCRTGRTELIWKAIEEKGNNLCVWLFRYYLWSPTGVSVRP